MRAMVYTKPGTVETLDVDRPEPGEGEVVVDVAACGICGSELHGITTPGFRSPPLIMGHEFSGTTQDGRRVTVNPIVSCGSCDLCEQGREEICRQRSIIGIHRPGGFATQVAVPESSLHNLPATLPLEHGAFVEPLACAVHAWELASPGTRASVGIIGAGTIGLVIQLVAKHHGAHVTIVDIAQSRLDLAAQLGADRCEMKLSGEYDVIFDAVGARGTRRASLDRLKPGGVAVWVGLLSPEPDLDALDLIRFEKKVMGSFAYGHAAFTEAIELAPTLDLSWATEFSLEEGAQIFHELMNGRSDVVKALLRPATGSQ